MPLSNYDKEQTILGPNIVSFGSSREFLDAQTLIITRKNLKYMNLYGNKSVKYEFFNLKMKNSWFYNHDM